MKFPPSLLALTCAFATVVSAGYAETVKDREGAVRNDKAALLGDARWLYNDIPRGFEEAKRSGKPLMVVLRCVPCLACSGIDTQVLLQEMELSPLMDQFVCVRVINANALDLKLFQFDYDLSFSTLFFNADGTLYGRYGSWIHQKDAQEKSTASFRAALQGALALHRGYPANKNALSGKQGGPMPFQTSVDIPTLAAKYTRDLNWDGKVVQSCVHCHQIGDALRLTYRDEKKSIPPEWIYPFPSPETVGLILAPDQVAHVESVAPGSAAALAGIRAGDDLSSLAEQSLISIADVSWVLHRSPESGTLPVIARRDGKDLPLTLALTAGWRAKSDISRRVGTWPMRGMAFGGMVLEDLADPERSNRHLGAQDLALFVKSVGQYGKHAAAKNAGFQKDDFIVGIDGLGQRLTEGELLGYLLQKHVPGETVPVKVLRGSDRIELRLPMQ